MIVVNFNVNVTRPKYKHMDAISNEFEWDTFIIFEKHNKPKNFFL